jgi:starch synthase
MVSSECGPLAKVGGLGDVVPALAGALAEAGHDVRIVLPLYGEISRRQHDLRPLPGPPWQLQAGQAVRLARWYEGGDTPRFYLLECEPLFGRIGIYGPPGGGVFGDRLVRTVGLCRAALQLPTHLGWNPEVIHAHDATTALVPVYHQRWYGGVELLGQASTLLTIHNIGHQEEYPAWDIAQLGLEPALATFPGPLEFYGRLNLLKGGILAATRVNTVSPTHAHEIVTDAGYGCGLDGVLRSRGESFSGILNGIDVAAWDPATDGHLPARFTADSLAGKQECRQALAVELGLSGGDGPLAAVISRLVYQKGIDLVLDVIDPLVAAGFSLVVLGRGEDGYRQALAAAEGRHSGRLVAIDRFDEGLARRILGGCDLFLVPSRYEPCGLTQMYAMRYGAVPLVRRTGGLADTVRDADGPEGCGFLFDGFTRESLLGALARARAWWDRPEQWRELMRRGMAADFGWARAAAAYEHLYEEIAPPPTAPKDERA